MIKQYGMDTDLDP